MRRIPESIAPILLLSAIVIVLSPSLSSAHDVEGDDRQQFPFRISILMPDGSLDTEFIATGEDMHIDQVKWGPDGLIWLTRADNSHSHGQPNPNDMVAVFLQNGTEVMTYSGGGMRHPLSVGWDSFGNVYVPAEDVTFASDVYKYSKSGTYLTKFHTQGWTLIDEYNDIVTESIDRLYVSSWHGTGNDDQMTEFTADGGTVNTFSPTGPLYYHRDIALSHDHTIWVRMPRNGTGDDVVREFDLDGNLLDSFSTSAGVPGSNMRGLEVHQGTEETLFTINVNDRTLYEFDRDGNVVGSTVLQGISNWIADFTFGAEMKIWVANQSTQPLDVAETAPPVAGRLLMANPNPFTGVVEFTFPSILNDRGAALFIFDVSGRLVRSLDLSGSRGPVIWDGTASTGRSVPAGTYFVRLNSGDRHETTRLLLIR